VMEDGGRDTELPDCVRVRTLGGEHEQTSQDSGQGGEGTGGVYDTFVDKTVGGFDAEVP
jgi:hypothetical protein